MTVQETVDKVILKAKDDPALKEALLATESTSHAADAFCKVCTEYGYPLYVMDLICAQEEAYAAMRRSTNGGGENSPLLDGEDDLYEMAIASLKRL